MSRISKIAVFCGSSPGINSIYSEKTKLLAQTLLNNKIDLVYGGSNIGLMRVIADEMYAGGADVIGVMPKTIAEKNVVNYKTSTKIITCDTMQERKRMLIDLSDAFIVLPGGFGSLDELFEVCSENQLDIIDKPIGIFNINNYYNHLISQLYIAVEEGFMRPQHRDSILVANTPKELLTKLNTYKKQPIDKTKWWIIDK